MVKIWVNVGKLVSHSLKMGAGYPSPKCTIKFVLLNGLGLVDIKVS